MKLFCALLTGLFLLAPPVLAAEGKMPAYAPGPAYHRAIPNKLVRDVDLKLFKIRVETDGRLTRVRKLSSAETEMFKVMKEVTFVEYLFDLKIGGKDGKPFTVSCDAGPSLDPQCNFSTPGDPNKVVSLIARRFIIPGDGCVYTSGHADSYFAVRRKYCLTPAGNLAEVVQPALYVGLKSKTLRPVTLYSERDLQTIVTRIEAKEPIEVLLMQGELYLVRDGFGLVGWAKIEAGQWAVDVEGLFYFGD